MSGGVTHTKYTSGELAGEHVGYDRDTGRSFYAGHNYVRERNQEKSNDSSNSSCKDTKSSYAESSSNYGYYSESGGDNSGK